LSQVMYFGLLEGIWGLSLGKLLLGIRVRDARGSRPPGLLRGLVRSFVFVLLLGIGSLADVKILMQNAPASHEDYEKFLRERRETGLMLALLPQLGIVVGIILMLLPARARNGNRCLHEWVSGTRVIAMPPRPRRKLRIPSFIPASESLQRQPPER